MPDDHPIEKENIRLQAWVVAVGSLLMAAKFVAYFVTHSNAILTDALESIINVVAGGFALYSLILSAKPKDANHPYGHGKIEFISATLEGSLIITAGAVIIFKSVYNFFSPPELEQLDIGIILTVVAGLVNYAVGFITERKGHKTHSLTLIAGGKHLKSDAYSTAGLVVGLLIIYVTGYLWLDSVIAIIFGGIICFTGYRILRASVAGIMDEADYELLKEIVKVLNDNRRENWIDIHNLRVIKYGSTLHIDCHLTVPWYLNVKEAHDEVEAVHELIRNHFERNIEFFIHLDPCIESQCWICRKENCEVRQHPFRKQIEWEFENVISNKKHGLTSP
ncbi:MAG: cation diffusion facilitator family transporter [Hymenobacteraceae bacterium]|nr:cation diffusion facilitator family transporter [Hymenobacteraceae bacterium]MDX5397356.1 cation diffusion facilitator family transporter [Hymenobacteraceae bacterium]MDX5443901.1 cation diffusion facilitator family transporter [Hymenobacteraceae bacterium]MDX5513436.1 cation diffusion facilitator family transporter [Hymenobacteraceae bacterium]